MSKNLFREGENKVAPNIMLNRINATLLQREVYPRPKPNIMLNRI